jgi:hypothetical protein
MLHNQHVDFLVNERHQLFLAEAAERRLSAQLTQPAHRSNVHGQHLVHWLGARLVQWGLRLQGEPRPLLAAQPPEPSLG